VKLSLWCACLWGTIWLSACPIPRPAPAEVTASRAYFLMGTVCELSATAHNRETVEASLDAGFQALQDADNKLSDYKPESELSTLSREGYQRAVPLSPRTREALALALSYAEKTQGAFDPTVGPLVDLWRSAKKSQQFPSPEAIEAARQKVDYRALVLDAEGGRLQKPEMRLDLGGIAKGLAEDWAAEAMRGAGALGGRVNLGGQVLVFGKNSTPAATVALPDPRDPKKIWYRLRLHEESIATTADYERGLDIQGKRVSHVFDPRTGQPCEKLLAAVVVAPRGVDADALTKPLFVLGEEAGLQLVRAAKAEALLMRRDGTIFATEQLRNRLLP
jgi:thiamine biosynthesis lipoprotein